MKKIVMVFLMFLLLTPAISFAGDRHWHRGGGYDRGHNSGYHHRDRHINPWAVFGAAIAGAVVYDIVTTPPRYYHYPERRYMETCYSLCYGEWRHDRYGRYWYEYEYPRKMRVPCW